GRSAAVLLFEALTRGLHLAGSMTDQPRDPVHGAEFVQYRAADARGAVGLELHAATEVVGIDGVHEAEEPGAHEVLDIDLVRQALVDLLGVVADQREELLDEEI